MEKGGKLKFPDGFLWGAATSTHQVEGNNHNDWSEWEKANAERLVERSKTYWEEWQRKKFPEMFDPQNYISGRACDHYNRYEEDFDIAKSLGHNAHRFSIEWSRIEPEEGKFDEKEIEHYRSVLMALKQRNIEPFVTLWHWTNPLWLTEIGGPESRKFAFYFSRYAKYVVEKLDDLVTFWLTINEPTSIIAMAYIRGDWPPQKKSYFSALKLYRNFSKAHNEAYDAIHSVSQKAEVGLANILHSFEPYREDSWLDKLAIYFAKYFTNERMLLLTKGKHDFLTAQYYFHNRFKFPKKVHHGDKPVNDLNWEIYPQGMYDVLQGLKKYNLPVYITESGLADRDDTKREKFIKDHLYWTHKAISAGVDVRGYFYWSLIDNFEWNKGFWPRFGLVEVDYKTLERRIRPSAWGYKKIIEQGLS